MGMVALVFFHVPTTHAAPAIYVPNNSSNTVSVIDGSTYSTIKTISVGQDPYGVGVSPDGKTVFVTNMAADTVSVIDAGSNTVTNIIRVGDFPFAVAVSPDGRHVYVANAADDNISVIETSGYSLVAHISVGDSPHGIVIHPDGSKLYVSNYFGSTVSVIDTSNYSVIKTINVGTYPHGIAIDPSGAYVYTANVLGDSLSVISTTSNSVIKTVNTGKYPFFPAIDPSGRYLYVSNYGSDSVNVVDLSSHGVVGTIGVGSAPHGISLDASGLRAYVANEGSNSVSVIDTSSRSFITSISVGTKPISFGNAAAEPRIPSPKGENSFTPYTDAVIPIIDSDPGKAKPIGLGTIAGVGATLSLSLGAAAFSIPMDVYLGLSMPAIDPANLYLFTGAGLRPISAGLLPWKSSVTDISSVVVPGYDALLLPTGTYGFFLRVVPAGTPAANLSIDYYQWTSLLSVVRASDVANKAIALFGTDLAATVAIFLAADKGYSLDQIIAAIDTGTLSFVGEIQGQGGGNISSGLRAGKWGGVVADAYCADLDPTNPIHRDSCATLIAEALEELREIFGDFRAERMVMLEDVGYTSAQIDAFKGHGCCELTNERIEVKCCKTKLGACDNSDCVFIEPADPPTNKLTETLDAICPILGGNRDSRILSENPFMFSQAAPPILGFSRNSRSDSCTPTCTDSDGDGYYIQSGCGTGGAVDCNDSDSKIRPGLPESCADGIDNNCDGLIDAQDPGCTPTGGCADPYPKPCGSMCYPAGTVCCSGGGACEGGSECCGEGCMPAGNVCCAPVGHCPPGNTCDYKNEKCISPGTGASDFLTQCTEWQPALERQNNDFFAVKD